MALAEVVADGPLVGVGDLGQENGEFGRLVEHQLELTVFVAVDVVYAVARGGGLVLAGGSAVVVGEQAERAVGHRRYREEDAEQGLGSVRNGTEEVVDFKVLLGDYDH